MARFGALWISDDRAELGVEMINDDGSVELFILQATPGEDTAEPVVTDICVMPEVFDTGWTCLA
jgi:hypothetical protein